MATIPIHFSITPAAKIEIERLRLQWNKRTSDPAVAIWIGWGVFDGKDGRKFENFLISFVGESQRAASEPFIQTASGEDIAFFVTDETRIHFEGRTLDFDSQTGLFLSDDAVGAPDT